MILRGWSHTAIANIFYVGCLSLLLPGCAIGNTGTFFEAAVAPDQQLQPDLNGDNAASLSPSQSCSTSILSQLPNTFPVPLCYPDARLLGVDIIKDSNPVSDTLGKDDVDLALEGEILKTQWSTNRPLETIQQFYQTFFDQKEWQVTRLPNELAGAGLFQAVQGKTRITIRFSNFSQLSAQASDQTRDLISISKVQPIQYTLEYRTSVPFERDSNAAALQRDDRLPTASEQSLETNSSTSRIEQDAEEDTEQASVKTAVADSETTTDAPPNGTGQGREPNVLGMNDVPVEIKDYVEAGLALGIVSFEEDTTVLGGVDDDELNFRPNEPITRREFARWLVQANNRLYDSQPHKQLRLATNLSAPAFEDIRPTDPDFRTIQGLAEAGLIPSQLSNNAETDNALFRGDAPLTRETLIAWKIPLDVHQGLPVATVETIQETWGFQDATKINPRALNAIAADYQNGDRANLRRAFGYTLLFQPQKSVTRAEAAAALWYFGTEEEGMSATELLENQTTNDQN